MSSDAPDNPSAPDDALRAKSDADAIKLFLSHRDVACPGCGYNLRGLTTTACPECGRAVTLRLAALEALRPLAAGVVSVSIALGCSAIYSINGLIWVWSGTSYRSVFSSIDRVHWIVSVAMLSLTFLVCTLMPRLSALSSQKLRWISGLLTCAGGAALGLILMVWQLGPEASVLTSLVLMLSLSTAVVTWSISRAGSLKARSAPPGERKDQGILWWTVLILLVAACLTQGWVAMPTAWQYWLVPSFWAPPECWTSEASLVAGILLLLSLVLLLGVVGLQTPSRRFSPEVWRCAALLVASYAICFGPAGLALLYWID